MFNMFGLPQPSGEKSLMCVGNGSTTIGSASSVTFVTQTAWIKNVPIVRSVPEWIDRFGEYILGRQRHVWLKRYYETRFAFLFSKGWSLPSTSEYTKTYLDAVAFANRLCRNDDCLFPDEAINQTYISNDKLESNTKVDKMKIAVLNKGSGKDSHARYDESRFAVFNF